jgi:glycosyltransferase involved in cell wall biosynthesis
MVQNVDSNSCQGTGREGAPGPVEPCGHMDDRLAHLEKEQTKLRRELSLVQDQLANIEARLTQLDPILRIWSLMLSGLGSVAGMAMLPFRAAKMLATAPTVAKSLKEATLRSERLVKDSGGWALKLDRGAYLSHASRAIGISRPTIYRVRPQQRLSITERPRILHVIPNVWVGGSTQLILDLHDYLGHRFEMKVVTSALPAHGRHEGMRISVVPKSRLEVRRLFTSFRPHIVHIHYWGDVDQPWYTAFFEVAAEFGCPILQNINTPVAPFASVQVARNVFVSQAILDRFGTAVPAQVIHPGIDLELFSPPENSDPDAYDAIGMVYRLEPDKLTEASIEPFITVVRRRPQTRAIIIGDGSLFPHFRARVQEDRLLNRFEFMGYIPYEKLPLHYARFKVFVAPVWQESFGQVVAFAMSMGLAVAGNRVGAIPEILGDASTLGTTPDELATHIVRLLESREIIDAIGARNRSIARSNFSVKRMAVAYLDLYKTMIPGAAELMPDYPPAVHFPL